jgi:hypothetical protein
MRFTFLPIILLKVLLKSVVDVENFVIKPKIQMKKWDIFSMKCRIQWHASFIAQFVLNPT